MKKLDLIDIIDDITTSLNGVHLAVIRMCECASPDPNQSDAFNAWTKIVFEMLKSVKCALGDIEADLKKGVD